MSFCYEILNKPVEGCVYIRDGLWIDSRAIPDHSTIYDSIYHARMEYEVIYSYSKIIHYAESESGMDTYGIVSTPLDRLENTEMVIKEYKVVGFFINRYIGQAHLFLFDDPSTHLYIVDSETKYELRKIM